MGSVGPFGGVTVPAPTFHHSFNNDSGTGTTATADIGDDCTFSGSTNPAWSDDDAGGNAVDFDGLAQNQKLACGSALDNPTDFSVGAWFFADSYGGGGFGRIINKNSTGNTKWTFRLGDTADNVVFAFVNTTGAADTFESPTDSMDACVGVGWCHVGISVSGCSDMSCAAVIYINGSAVTTTQTADNAGTPKDDAALEVNIGGLANPTNTFEGDIDEVKVWATDVLTAPEWSAVHAAGR
jgi:hypothetical protein